MKQLLFLLLFPCLAMAQYQGNANQKITLGEQTTADGLVWRGRLADTANLLTNKLDTSVYIVLDTGTRAMWYYRASTTPKWTRLVDSLNNLQGQLSLTSKVTGVLPVANGGTNLTTFTAANRIPYASSATALTTSSNLTYNNSTLVVGNENDNYDNLALKNKAATNNTNRRAGLTANTYEGDSLVGIMSVFAGVSDRSLVFGGGVSNLKNPTDITFFTSTNVENPVDRGSRHRMYINNIGDIGLGTLSPSEKLHVVGNGLFTGNLGIGSATPTTSGTGITFPATQSASTNVNTLDDYEEGTWTPILGGNTSTSGQTYVYQIGRYTKIGRLVYCTFEVKLSTKGTITTRANILGLPFMTSGTAAYLDAGSVTISFFQDLASNQIYVSGYLIGDKTQLELTATNTATTLQNNLSASDAFNDNTRIAGTIIYFAN